MTLLETARMYVFDFGFSVFPLVYREKVPFAGWKWGVLQHRKPTEAEITAWFTCPVNLAIVTGRVSGNLQVLDFDEMGVFSAWWEQVRLKTGFVQTGKGVHVYVRLLEGEEGYNGDFCVNGLHAGQARFDGGYVVAPPSIHPSGKLYVWKRSIPLAMVRFDALHITPETTNAWPTPLYASQRPDSPSQRASVTYPVRYARVALEAECDKVRQAPIGKRNNTLYRACLKVKKYVVVLGAEAVTQALSEAGCQSGLGEREVVNTIRSAWKYAK